MGGHPAVLSPDLRDSVDSTLSPSVSLRTTQIPAGVEADQSWWTGRDARWKVWGYSSCRCPHELCEGLGGDLCEFLHVLLTTDLEYGQARPDLWRGAGGALDYCHSECHPTEAMSD